MAVLLILLALSGIAAAQDEAAGPVASATGTAFSPFKPGIAVIIAILTMFFCITFLILLYAKHCNNGTNNDAGNGVVSYYFGGSNMSSRAANFPVCARKNSGVDRSLVESLPVFRFASLRGQKDGLECAVCLNRFESVEVLRLLPKCKHAFHVECVDTWLDAHSTCPLCRYRVDPEDLLLVIEPVEEQTSTGPEIKKWSGGDLIRKSFMESIRRISGRHSYAGAGERGLLPEETASYRRSHDDRVKPANAKYERHSRKDGLLMTKAAPPKVEHRIIISDEEAPPGRHERWSDVEGADLLYLRSEMVMKEGGGGSVMNRRSVSDMTGMSRVAVTGEGERKMESRRSDLVRVSREAGAVARWTAWISQPRDVRSLNV